MRRARAMILTMCMILPALAFVSQPASASLPPNEWLMPNADVWFPLEWYVWPVGGHVGWDKINDYGGAGDSRWIGSDEVGWLEGMFAFEDPENEPTDYYNVTISMIARMDGQSYPDEDYGILIGIWTIGLPTTVWSQFYQLDLNYANKTLVSNTNPVTNMPWTYNEVKNMCIRVLAWYDHVPSNPDWKIRITLAALEIRPTYGPKPPALGLIIRPEDDRWAYWEPYPASPTTKFDKINETTNFGNGMDDYMYSLSDSTVEGWFDMQNLSGQPPDQVYEIYIWVIAKTIGFDSDAMLSIAIVQPKVGYLYTYVESYKTRYSLSPAWFNYTVHMAVNPLTDQPFTLTEINDLIVYLATWYAAPSGVYVTQMAVLCVPTVPLPPPSPPEEPVTKWLGEGNGILTIIGVIGFIGLVATPAIAVILYRTGDEEILDSAGYMIFLMILFFGFLMAGLVGT